jgi:hypothetical protein
VSTRFDQYAEAYDELRILRELFRFYIAAVQITSSNEALCERLEAIPLLTTEKVAAPLPEYHSSELFITVANYKTISRNSRQARFIMASSINGGVSIAGKRFYESAIQDGVTPIIQNTKRRIAANNFSDPDDDPSRRFILFTLDDALAPPVRVASNLRGNGGSEWARPDRGGRSADPSQYEIENEPPSAKLPIFNNKMGWILLVLALLGVLTAYRRSRGSHRLRI